MYDGSHRNSGQSALRNNQGIAFGMDIRVELLTGSVKGKKREAILSGLLTGDVKDPDRYARGH